MTTVFRNAFIYTADTQHSCIPDGALIVQGTSIKWLGPDRDVVVPRDAEVIDVNGRLLMPGMINAHTHAGMSVYRGLCDDGDFPVWAAKLAPYTSNLTLEDNRLGGYIAATQMVRSGVTTACDCTRYGAGIFSQVALEVGMRSLSGALANSPSLRSNGQPNWPSALDETLDAMVNRGKSGLARFYLGAHSPYNCTKELLIEVKKQADKHRLPFVIHVAEMQSEVEITLSRFGKRPLAYLADLGLLDNRTIMAHCVWLDDSEMEILARSGAGVVHNPVSNAKLASGIARIPDMVAKRIPVALGTDGMLSNNSQSVFQEMKTAVLLQRASQLDGNLMRVEDILDMAFLGGARVLGWDDQIGSLEKGKLADIVVLDLFHALGLSRERVMSDIVYHAGPENVELVMVHGEIIYEDREFTLLDWEETKHEISQYYSLKH